MGATYTEAQKKATQKYQESKLEKLQLWFPKGIKEKYKAYAQSRGVSLTKLFMELVEKDMRENGFKFDGTDEK